MFSRNSLILGRRDSMIRAYDGTIWHATSNMCFYMFTCVCVMLLYVQDYKRHVSWLSTSNVQGLGRPSESAVEAPSWALKWPQRWIQTYPMTDPCMEYMLTLGVYWWQMANHIWHTYGSYGMGSNIFKSYSQHFLRKMKLLVDGILGKDWNCWHVPRLKERQYTSSRHLP